MKILKELKEFEDYLVENNDLQAELLYNAQETIKIMIEDTDSLISAAEAYIESSSMTAVHVMAMRKRLQQAIKEAKG